MDNHFAYADSVVSFRIRSMLDNLLNEIHRRERYLTVDLNSDDIFYWNLTNAIREDISRRN